MKGRTAVGDRRFQPLTWLVVGVLLLLPWLTGCTLPQVSAEERLFLPLSLEFLDAHVVPKQEFQTTKVGGLSALTYNRQRDRFYALSDDRSEYAPARFYTLSMALDATAPATPKIQAIDLTDVTFLTDETGAEYAPGTLDPEGIALSPLGTLFVASEGVAKDGIPPTVREYDLKTGAWKRSLPIPTRYAPQTAEGKLVQGVGDNIGFEALTLNMTGGSTIAIEPFRLFTATESALTQDSSPEHPQQGTSRNRLLHYSLTPTQALVVSEHLYPMETPPEGALYHGLVELLAIDQGGHFLSLERSFGANGITAKVFQLAMGGATDTSTIEQFQGPMTTVQPIRKKLLLDLTTLGIPLDNLEGMALGPQLPGGSPSLVLLSDDNFRLGQVTQVLLFRLQGLK